jgi:glycosyltransferase involved in cell wall biosynthesis
MNSTLLKLRGTRVLMITGDKSFKPGHERYELQRSAVELLEVVYWGRGSLWPKLPAGKFDVVTTQDPFVRGLFGWWVAKRKGAKLNVQVHTDLSVYGGVKHVLMQIVLRHADSLRVVSNKIKQQVERIGVRAKITVLPVFVDISKFQQVVQQPHTGKNILWIGRFEAEKDPLLAVEVFKKVLKAEPSAKLIMLGRGSLQGLLMQAASNLPVEFPGWQDPSVFLATADVVLCTSVHESWGASIVEALAAGVPVVAPDVGIAKEAGATIVPRDELHTGVLGVLATGQKPQLQIQLLDKESWVKMWAASL